MESVAVADKKKLTKKTATATDSISSSGRQKKK
jgi:hypothetical protein